MTDASNVLNGRHFVQSHIGLSVLPGVFQGFFLRRPGLTLLTFIDYRLCAGELVICDLPLWALTVFY